MVGEQVLNVLPTNLAKGIGHANGVNVNDVDVNMFDQIVTFGDKQIGIGFLDFDYQNNIFFHAPWFTYAWLHSCSGCYCVLCRRWKQFGRRKG